MTSLLDLKPTSEAMKQVETIEPEARALGWSRNGLINLACSLDRGEVLGEVRQNSIEIITAYPEDFRVVSTRFPNWERLGVG